MNRLYDASQYDATRSPPTYWAAAAKAAPPDAAPLTGDAVAEVAVVGGGICGLSCAYHLAHERGTDVALVEAGPLGWGASGRNAGFVCHGAIRSAVAPMLKRFGEVETRAALKAESAAIELVSDIAAAEALDIGRQGEAVVTIAHKPSRWAELSRQIEAFQRYGLGPALLMSREGYAERGFASPAQHGALIAPGFGLNPLRYVRGLARAAAKRGARLHANSPVEELAREASGYRVRTPSGTLRARRVVIAANAYLDEALLPGLDGRLLPVLSNIIVTRPLSKTELAAHNYTTDDPVSDTRKLLSYFRLLPDRRLLFGGRGDTTGTAADGLAMRAQLAARLAQVFPEWAEVGIEHFWRGFVAFTRARRPALGRLADHPGIHFAMGCQGNGVAFMTWAGRALARLATGGDETSIPAPLRGLPARFPFPALRLWGLRALLGAYALHDRVA